MNKLEEGMYVRTEYGISKIVNVFIEKGGTFIETDNGLGNCNMSTKGKLYKGIYVLEENYKTFMNNNVKNVIIDLIEVGDYVNGYKVAHRTKSLLGFEDGQDGDWYLSNENIKSIVTKEMMEAIAYKVN